MTSKDKMTQFIITTIYYSIIILLSILAIKYLMKPLLPFIVAFFICSLLQKGVNYVCSSTPLSRKTAVSVITILVIGLLAIILYILCSVLLRELTTLAQTLTSDQYQDMFLDIKEKIQNILYKFSNITFLSGAEKSAENLFSEADKLISTLADTTLPHAVSGVMSFIKFFPGAVIFITFMLISLFYIGFNYEKITDFLKLQLSDNMRENFDEAKNTLYSTMRKIFKAYILLTFITFTQLLCGFWVLKIKYAILLSIIISVVDLLPILGTGTILVPWAIFCFFTDDIKRGTGILVLYGIITIFRRIAEPKIVGSNIGLSPLLALISMYAGLKTLGFLGIIFFPIILLTVISLNEKGIIRLYKNPTDNQTDVITKSKHKFLNFKKDEKSNRHR